MNGKRKNQAIIGRSPRARAVERIPSVDGIYHNASFMHAITSQIGNIVKVYTHTGAVYEGIFKTFSSNFDVVLKLAHKIDVSSPSTVTVNTVTEKIIFKAQDIIIIEIIDAELDYATRDTFQTDTAISKFNGQVSEKELEPWDGSGSHEEDCELDGNGSVNGWDVDEMFRQNEQMYGVTSTFDHALTGYTTQLQNKDSKDFKDAKAKASKIANEIESNPSYKARADVENGDEEEKFAAVVRPPSADNSNSADTSDKYVCPPKRKTFVPSKPARNQHVKISHSTDQKVNSNTYFHRPSYSNNSNSSSNNNSGPSNARERISAVNAPEPKPQRSSANQRHARTYVNENIRSNSHVNTNVSANSDAKTLTTTHQSNSGTPTIPMTPTVSTNDTPVHRKPPIPSSSQITPVEHHNLVQRKVSRGREEHFNELKKFSTDFKLSEASENKIIQVAPPVEEDSRISEDQNRISAPSVESPVETASPPANNIVSTPTNETDKNPNQTLSKSKLNPNAKEFVYNPNAKPFTPRSPSTPTQSRPHTPQTAEYGVQSVPSIPMVMPAYVVTTAQPHYTQPPNQPSQYRKVHMGMSQRPDLTSQMQVAAATGQPLLAPGPLPMQFTVPYSSQTHVAPQPYQQMVRMMTHHGRMVPFVPASLSYPPDATGQGQQIQYMGPAGITNNPYAPLHHNPHIHAQSNPTVSPQASTNGQLGLNGNGGMPPGGGQNSGAANSPGGQPPHHHTPPSPASSYGQPPPTAAPPNAPAFPLMCPIIPAPPPPPPPHNPHHLISGVPSNVHIHHHHQPHQHPPPANQVPSQQTHHIQVILPHNQ